MTKNWRHCHYEVQRDEARPTHPTTLAGALPIDASIHDRELAIDDVMVTS